MKISFHSLYIPLWSAAHLHMFKQCLPLCKGKKKLYTNCDPVSLIYMYHSSVTQWSKLLTKVWPTDSTYQIDFLIICKIWKKQHNQSIRQSINLLRNDYKNHLETYPRKLEESKNKKMEIATVATWHACLLAVSAWPVRDVKSKFETLDTVRLANFKRKTAYKSMNARNSD